MRKIINKYQKDGKLLIIWGSKNYLTAEIKVNGRQLTKVRFLKSETAEEDVIFNVGMKGAYKLYEPKINKMRRVIWTNDDYDEWKDAMIEGGEDEETLTYERYYDDCSINMEDEMCNLDVEVNGYIVALANLGLWHGRVHGAKMVGTNVKDILSGDCGCDYCTWFCDPFNVRFEGTHHDGRNYILYRVAKSKEQAERLVDKIAFGGMSVEQFRKATKSLRPYIAKVYGW